MRTKFLILICSTFSLMSCKSQNLHKPLDSLPVSLHVEIIDRDSQLYAKPILDVYDTKEIIEIPEKIKYIDGVAKLFL